MIDFTTYTYVCGGATIYLIYKQLLLKLASFLVLSVEITIIMPLYVTSFYSQFIRYRNRPGSKRQISYDLTYKWNLINKTNKRAK